MRARKKIHHMQVNTCTTERKKERKMAYKKIHQIRIDFNVTEEIRRYVFVYIIEAEVRAEQSA